MIVTSAYTFAMQTSTALTLVTNKVTFLFFSRLELGLAEFQT